MRQDPCIDADGEPVVPYGLAACYPERFEEGDGDDGVDDKAMGGRGEGRMPPPRGVSEGGLATLLYARCEMVLADLDG
jgi:hypothetical protein